MQCVLKMSALCCIGSVKQGNALCEDVQILKYFKAIFLSDDKSVGSV